MAANSDPIFVLTPLIAGVQFTASDTTSKKTLATGATNGTRIDDLTCSTNDTVAVNVGLYVQVAGAGADYYLGNVYLAPGAGYTTVAGIDAIAALPLSHLNGLFLNAGDVLKAACAATMSGGGVVTDLVAVGGTF